MNWLAIIVSSLRDYYPRHRRFTRREASLHSDAVALHVPKAPYTARSALPRGFAAFHDAQRPYLFNLNAFSMLVMSSENWRSTRRRSST